MRTDGCIQKRRCQLSLNVNRSFLSAAALGGVSRGIAVLARFVSVPLTITLLSQERYGLWLIIGSLIGWLGFSDLGIPAALQNRLIHVLRTEGETRGRAVVAYAFRLLGGIAALLLIAGGVAAFTIPWQSLFKIPADFTPEFVATLALCLVSFAVGLPSRVGSVIYNAYGRLAMPPLADIIAQLVSLGMLLLAVWLQWASLLALVACSLAAIVAGPALLTILACKRYGYGLSPATLAPGDRPALLGKGLFFFLTIIGELLILQSDAFLVGSILGAGSVPLLLVPLALFINFIQAQNIFLRPLWPILSNQYSAGDRSTLARTMRRTFGLSALLGAAFLVGIVLIGPWFIHLWSRGVVEIDLLMAVGLGLYGLVGAMDNAINTCINAFGFIELRFGYTLLYGVVKVGATILILQHATIDWLPLVYALVMLTCSLPFACWGLKRAISRMPAANPQAA